MTGSDLVAYENYQRKEYLTIILKLTGLIFLIAMAAGLLLSFLVMPVQAIEINPSVENQPFLCKYFLTKWILCDTTAPGPKGVNGTQGIQGPPNFSAIYYNASNFTTSQNASTFINATNFTSNSNYTVFEGGTFYNGTINESYAYKPGLPGGQILQGGIASTDALTLNGSANNGNVILQPNMGSKVGVGCSTPVVVFDVNGEIQSNGTIYANNGYLNVKPVSGTLYLFEGQGNLSGAITYFRLTNEAPAAANVGSGVLFSGSPSVFQMGKINVAWRGSATTDSYMQFMIRKNNIAATEAMRITNDSFLGIGTTTPTSQLDTTAGVRFRNCSGTPVMDTGGNMTCVSDEKYKTAITPFVSDTSKLATLTPKQYKWSVSSGFDTTHINTGFSAQDVQLVYPECVIARDDVTYVQDIIKGKTEAEDKVTTREVRTGTQTLSLDDRCLIAVLWNAAKSLDANNTAQQAKINSLEQRIINLEKGVVKP